MKALLLVFLLAVAARGADLGRPVAATPYDPYFASVRVVLARPMKAAPSLAQARRLTAEAFAFRYAHYSPYVPMLPQLTARVRAGDCKDKALWLVAALGDPAARFVVGEARAGSRVAHAWVLWPHGGRWYVLDPAAGAELRPAATLSRASYVPRYSYAPGGAFAHAPRFTTTRRLALR